MKLRNIEISTTPFAESTKFRMYLGNSEEYGPVILKVAKTFEDNDALNRETNKFTDLQTIEEKVAEFEQKSGKTKSSRFDLLFAQLKETFTEPTLDDRRINVYGIVDPDPNAVINLDSFVPLTKLENDVEIDSRTSVWIIGRLLKFYSLFELLAAEKETPIVRYPNFSPSDYLIGPERHRLVYYIFSGDLDDVVATAYVKAIAKFILDWVDFDDADEKDLKYQALLEDFAENGRDTAGEAHAELYELVDELWGIHYYPFTYRPKSSGSNLWLHYGGDD